jgi:hypothetical protein
MEELEIKEEGPGAIFTKLLKSNRKIFVILGLNIMIFLKLKVFFKANIMKG